MKHRVSRRNGRALFTHTLPLGHLALCSISLIVFIGGASTLSWAVSQHREPPSDSQRHYATTRLAPSDGEISSSPRVPSNDADPNADSSEASDVEALDPSAAAPDGLSLPASRDDSPAQPDLPSSSQSTAPSAPQASASSESNAGDPTTAPAPQQGKVVHHTAAREETTYKTVHHQASTAREVTVGGVSRIEWTSCPVCGSRHERAYNERVVDHVTRVGCTACGAFHDSSYNETVWDR